MYIPYNKMNNFIVFLAFHSLLSQLSVLRWATNVYVLRAQVAFIFRKFFFLTGLHMAQKLAYCRSGLYIISVQSLSTWMPYYGWSIIIGPNLIYRIHISMKPIHYFLKNKKLKKRNL